MIKENTWYKATKSFNIYFYVSYDSYHIKKDEIVLITKVAPEAFYNLSMERRFRIALILDGCKHFTNVVWSESQVNLLSEII